MDEIGKLCERINICCEKIAERDGFELPRVGGYIKKDNKHGGSWSWIEGPGKYIKKDGEMQWELNE